MSFKVNTNQGNLQKAYKKHQTNELLVNDIPNDEVFFMRDGRITCLVCYAKPILDNINILQIHRNGRKHKEKYEIFKQRKVDDLQTIEKRLLETERKGGCTKLLHKKRQEILNTGGFSAKSRSHLKAKHPKVKVQLQTTSNLLSNSSNYIESLSAVSDSNRNICLEKVQKTIQSMNNVETNTKKT